VQEAGAAMTALEAAKKFTAEYITITMRPPHRPDVMEHCFIAGANWMNEQKREHMHLKTEMELAGAKAQIEKLVKALERECCCTGETSWTTKQLILCDACEALAEWRSERDRQA
jgi:hypothetical protein